MAVVVAVELEYLLAPREAAGEPDGAHRGLCAGVGHPHDLYRGDGLAYQLGELDLELRRRAEGRALAGCALDGLDHLGIGVAEVRAARSSSRSPRRSCRPRR